MYKIVYIQLRLTEINIKCHLLKATGHCQCIHICSLSTIPKHVVLTYKVAIHLHATAIKLMLPICTHKPINAKGCKIIITIPQ